MDSNLPKGWIETTLGEIAEWASGGTPKATESKYYGGDIPWLIIGDLNDGEVYKSAKTITRLGLENSSAKIAPINSVLIAMYGSIGKLGIAKIECATNQAIAFTQKIYGNIPYKFLYYYLFSIREDLLKQGKGGAQQNISQTVLKEVPFPLPPLPEQQRIVEKLDALMARISNSKTRLEKIPALLKNFRQSVLAVAVNGELTKEWREEKKRKLVHYDKVNDLKEIETSDIHSSWIKTKLDNVSSRVSVGHVGPTSKYYTDKEKGIPFLRSQNVRPGRIDFEGLQYITKEFHNSLKKSQLKPGDLLVVRVGANCGDACILPDNLGEINCANIVFARPNQGISSFLGLFFISPSWLNQIDEISTGSAQPVINTAIVAETILDLPSLEEQKEIVRKVEELFHFADSIEARYQKAKAWFDKLPQSILVKAFRGELVSQNENDEPVSILLERTKKEKQIPSKSTKKEKKVDKRSYKSIFAFMNDIQKSVTQSDILRHVKLEPSKYLIELNDLVRKGIVKRIEDKSQTKYELIKNENR